MWDPIAPQFSAHFTEKLKLGATFYTISLVACSLIKRKEKHPSLANRSIQLETLTSALIHGL